MKSNLWCHLKAILERIWPHCTVRIWRSPTSEGSRRQLFWQLASSSCHFGTPNNQRALYVWVSSDKEQETALISHKKQTDWKKNHDREFHNHASWKMNFVVLFMPSYISPAALEQNVEPLWCMIVKLAVMNFSMDCVSMTATVELGVKKWNKNYSHHWSRKNILLKCSLSDLALN